MGRVISSGLGLRFELPADITRSSDASIDEAGGAWTGEGLSVVVDSGPFVDSLTRYSTRPGYGERRRDLGDRQLRIVSFQSDDATRTIVARGDTRDGTPFTIAVHASEARVRDAERIIDSIADE